MTGMAPELAAFLARHEPVAEGQAEWPNGVVKWRDYLTTETPPLRFVGSVRGIVLRGESVLVVRNANGRHLLPGGRCEAGESPSETLARELLEETGWRVRMAQPIGFTWLHHLGPPPTHLSVRPELHPDFVWLIYVSEADEYHPEAKLEDDYELESAFVPLSEIDSIDLNAQSRLFLDAALKARLS